jgi:hypothetical protein
MSLSANEFGVVIVERRTFRCQYECGCPVIALCGCPHDESQSASSLTPIRTDELWILQSEVVTQMPAPVIGIPYVARKGNNLRIG